MPSFLGQMGWTTVENAFSCKAGNTLVDRNDADLRLLTTTRLSIAVMCFSAIKPL